MKGALMMCGCLAGVLMLLALAVATGWAWVEDNRRRVRAGLALLFVSALLLATFGVVVAP